MNQATPKTALPPSTSLRKTVFSGSAARIGLTAQALAAWEYTLKVASDEIEREEVYVHLARIKIGVGRFDEARQHLDAITNEMHTVIKNRLTRNLLEKETKAANAPPAAVDNK